MQTHPLLSYFRATLPPEIASLIEPYLVNLEKADFKAILTDVVAQSLFGVSEDAEDDKSRIEDFPDWNDYIFHRLGVLLADRRKPEKQSVFFCIGYAALLAFVQSNITGPPLSFSPIEVLFPQYIVKDASKVRVIKDDLLGNLSMDGVAPYRLTTNIELLPARIL